MQKRVIALGFFDGVHLGHQAILSCAVNLANRLSIEPAALTFKRHPRAFVLGISPPILTPFETRKSLMEGLGIKSVFALPFGESIANLAPQEFITMLREEYGCVAVVCGDNFRFGKNAAGGPDTLSASGIATHIVEPIKWRNQIVSSTLIRKRIRLGSLYSANAMLGRTYFLEGDIISGFQEGRRIGFPTINLRPEDGVLLPKRGVYASRVTVGKTTYESVTNIGVRPTFTDADIVSVESHILNFSGDIYGQRAKVEFVKLLRPEHSFERIDDLKNQIVKDVASAKEVLK